MLLVNWGREGLERRDCELRCFDGMGEVDLNGGKR